MANRLAQSDSLYLRKHADNPIDWWFWCEEALETARRENKPIFLSVGYSSCHWCTVMEGEAFSDLEIAAYLNQYFLPIKVDREERPDLDSIYMQALQLMVGQGGWPLNIFLTPDELIPFYGGTYFPVEAKYGRPAFLQILQALRRYYDNDKEKLAGVTGEILKNLQDSMQLQPTIALTTANLYNGLSYSTSIIAGRNPGPSFPMIPYADATLRGSRFALPEARHDPLETALQRGVDLALGGIFDHVAGGFHRYTVDPTWTVPHFEKMLYDNGQIVEFLANLWSTGYYIAAFERAIAYTYDWLTREMTAPEGYFYAAQDADSFVDAAALEPEEGAFYVWRYAELAAALSPQALSALAADFTLSEAGNFEGAIVLQRTHAEQLSPEVEFALKHLFQIRYGSASEALPTFPPARNNREAKEQPWPGRIPAVTDPKMIVAWNSLMISGLARAAAVLQNSDYFQLAQRCMQFIQNQQWIDDRLHRLNYEGAIAVLAQSEDYALLIKALLDLHQAAIALGNDPTRYLTSALQVQAEFDQYLWSPEFGGYFNTAIDASRNLIIRERNYIDNATPSANGIAAANLVRLSLLTDQTEYLDRAEQTLTAFGTILTEKPQACPSLISGLDWLEHATLVKTTPEQARSIAQMYLPTVVFTVTEDLPPGAIGLVCHGFTCLAPAQSEAELRSQIQQIFNSKPHPNPTS
jgi:uncharacterized protein